MVVRERDPEHDRVEQVPRARAAGPSCRGPARRARGPRSSSSFSPSRIDGAAEAELLAERRLGRQHVALGERAADDLSPSSSKMTDARRGRRGGSRAAGRRRPSACRRSTLIIWSDARPVNIRRMMIGDGLATEAVLPFPTMSSVPSTPTASRSAGVQASEPRPRPPLPAADVGDRRRRSKRRNRHEGRARILGGFANGTTTPSSPKPICRRSLCARLRRFLAWCGCSAAGYRPRSRIGNGDRWTGPARQRAARRRSRAALWCCSRSGSSSSSRSSGSCSPRRRPTTTC